MIKITKQEAKKLHEIGIQYGEQGISKTKNHHHPHYFLCESKYNMRKIRELRNKSIVRKNNN